MDIHLVDGTYELFRHYFALPPARDSDGREVAAARGVLSSVQGMLKGGATHIAVATGHAIESFRNGLWRDYKTGGGIEPDLLAQFPLLEGVLSAADIVVWPMIEFEADDALAAAAHAADKDGRVEQVMGTDRYQSNRHGASESGGRRGIPRVMTAEQIRLLLEQLSQPYRAMVLIAACLGPRPFRSKNMPRTARMWR